MIKPEHSVNCWFVSDTDMIQRLRDKRAYMESVAPFAYFQRISKIGDSVMKGYIGRYDQPEEYHRLLLTNFTYIGEYLQRKPVYITFDKYTLYRITEIFPSTPLLFSLTSISNLMINPEEIYQMLYKEQWPAIIDVLHKNKKEISGEPSLQHAARTFETIFLQKMDDFPIDDVGIHEALETLYMLHFGKFYLLNDDSLKRLTIGLAKRSPIKDAYNYAQKFPEDDEAREIIRAYQKLKVDKANRKKYVGSTYNWVEIFNRLFELINNQGDTATYFSGPRFIDAVREVLPYAPNYSQYIQLRNESGKSTSRKIFYYDLLMEQEPDERVEIIEKILNIVRPHEPQKSAAIDLLLGKHTAEQISSSPSDEKNIIAESKDHPVVFISYSWDDESHKEWVLALAEKLSNSGIEVLLDRYFLKPGKSLPHFVERSIERAHRVLIIFTPNYKLKADKRSGGVGYEYSIMNASLYENQTDNEKIIPVLRNGDMSESIPDFMRQFIHIDLRNDENFETSFMDLLREIFDEPVIKQPKIGSKPAFD